MVALGAQLNVPVIIESSDRVATPDQTLEQRLRAHLVGLVNWHNV